MENTKLTEMITYLFSRYWDEDLSDDEIDKLEQDADDLVAEFGWPDVYNTAVNYLHTECLTPESVINFASNYWTYGWYENPIPDPHRLLGYFYYRVNYETEKYDVMDILDSLATTILPKAGFPETNLVLNTQYMPENDPKIRDEVERFRSAENNNKF